MYAYVYECIEVIETRLYPRKKAIASSVYVFNASLSAPTSSVFLS